MTLGQFVAAAAQLEGSPHGVELVEALKARRVAATHEHDIGDPYRRGPEVARASASIMDELVTSVVSGLRSTQTDVGNSLDQSVSSEPDRTTHG
jgi:hypothetical protein